MADDQDKTNDQIEEHIGVTQPDAFEQTTTGEKATTRHLFADGGDGKEKEVTLRDHEAGASSDAPPSSGIPSAMTQHGVQREAVTPKPETPMADRVISRTQNLEP